MKQRAPHKRAAFLRYLMIPCLVALLASLRPVWAQTAPPGGFDPLTERILKDFEQAQLGVGAALSVYVADLPRGIVHVDINADRRMVPASNMKLITTAAALEILGSDTQFATTLEREGDIFRGTLQGNLVIRGGGDPSLGARFHKNRDRVLGVLEDWADELKRQGIRRISGDIVGDATRYVNEPHGTGWEPLEFGEWYSAEVSALNYNENVVDVVWRAGRRPGESARYELRPATSYITFNSSVRTGSERLSKPMIRYIRYADSNAIRSRGVMPPGAEKYEFTAIHDPANYTAKLMEEVLVRKGITVGGVAVSRTVSRDDGATSEPALLLQHQSPPLADLVDVVNRRSQNLYAEVLLRETALAAGHPASFAGGSRAVTDWLASRGLHRNGFLMIDGSGLSPLNRVTTRQLGLLLRYMNGTPASRVFRNSLPVAGMDGTLKSRFEGEDQAALRGAIQAKTGFIDGTHALSGYITHRRGTEYVFSIIVNDYDPKRTVEARNLVDQIVASIYGSEILP